jgi:hypothetical protein
MEGEKKRGLEGGGGMFRGRSERDPGKIWRDGQRKGQMEV